MVLSQVFNQLLNPNTAVNRRRRLFIPPSTNLPLFKYGAEADQRSFLSLDETSLLLPGRDDVSDVVSVASSRSLPSTLSSAHTNDDQESFHSWLVEEHQRRYYAAEDGSDRIGTPGAHSPENDRRSHTSAKSRGSTLSDVKSSVLLLDHEDFANLRTTFAIETRMLLRYSFPLIVTFILEHLFLIVCLLVVGHLGKNELAAVSLASMTSTITLAIFEGIATSLDTLCPQAYGAGNYELVSVHVQRCIAFSLCAYVPCALFWWYSGYILKYVIGTGKVLELTTKFLRILVAGGPAYIFFENSKRFLQAQGIFEAGTGVLFVSAPINIFLSWYLVWNETYGLGYIGAPIAVVINFWVMSLLLVMYVMFVDGSKCWFGLCKPNSLFQNWGQLSHLAVPGIVMLESEYVAYEIMTLLALYFGTVELAAQSAVGSIASLTYMVPFAVSIAVATRVANFIGAGNLFSAQRATLTGLCVAVALASVNCIVLLFFSRPIGGFFTNDPEVLDLIVSLFTPLVACLQIFDGLACVSNGVLRAQGLQKLGGVVNFVAYYAVAMPLAFVLTRTTDLKLRGLWIGVGTGMIMIAVIESLVIVNCNWEAVLERAGLMMEFNDSASDEDA